MLKNLFFLSIFFIIMSCQSNSQQVNNTQDSETISNVQNKNITAPVSDIQQAYYNIPNDIIAFESCLNGDTKENREKVITEIKENVLYFNEPCNGSLSEFVKLNDSPIYFLSICQGGPGCNQEIYLFEGEEMNEIENAFNPKDIEYLLLDNPLIKKRLKGLSEDIDATEILMISYNPENNRLELIPDMEFIDRRVPAAYVDYVAGKLMISPSK